MAHKVIMPKAGQTVESCLVTKWHKSVGDDVKKGDLLFSYETDKAAFDEEASVQGKLLAIFANEGDEVACLSNVCVIGEPGEDISMLLEAGPETKQEQSGADTGQQKSESEQVFKPQNNNTAGRVLVSPRARETARRQGVDAFLAVPTGAHGRVIERDIYVLSKKGASELEDGTITPLEISQTEYKDEKLSNVRRVIARTMHESLSTMAQLTNNSSFDATELLEYRKRLKSSGNIVEDITINDMILFAVSRVLIKYPALNAHMLDDKLRLFNSVNLGMAVDTDRGLLVPTLYNADKKTLSEISKKSKALISAARSGRIDQKLLANGTFTVTNLGSLGVESFTPIINPPQTAILGVCKIVTRVKEQDGILILYPVMGLSLTYDHRAVDGAPAARFAKEVGEMLENLPALMTI